MNSGFLLSVLAGISALTTLTVEAIKKILDEQGKPYSSNMLAVCTSFAITVLGSIMYLLYYSIPFTVQVAVVLVCLVFLSFLIATVGYDKVKQLLEQVGKKG